MSIVRVGEPVVLPVTLADVKLNMGVIETVEDALITLAIGEATRYAESYCGRSFITQTWRQTLDCFPRVIRLERGPVQAITELRYLDMNGTQQVVANPGAPQWAIDLDADMARLAPAFGYTWPNALPQIAAVRVTYRAGYGDAPANVPEGIRNWILGRVYAVFENREETAVVRGGGMLASLPHFDRMLDPYRVIEA